MRKFAISDIHGCRRSFAALLDQLEITTNDELYLLGDYIDRGPDSKGVIDLIFQMQASGYSVHCLRGNHEQMLLDLHAEASRKQGRADQALLTSFNVEYAQDIPSRYVKWMEELPYYFEIDDYLLVHAGFEFVFPDPLIDRKAMLWIRNWYPSINHDWLKGRTIVHGHTPTRRKVIERTVENTTALPAIVIDNGCVYHYVTGLGGLCALELGVNRLIFQEYVG